MFYRNQRKKARKNLGRYLKFIFASWCVFCTSISFREMPNSQTSKSNSKTELKSNSKSNSVFHSNSNSKSQKFPNSKINYQVVKFKYSLVQIFDNPV